MTYSTLSLTLIFRVYSVHSFENIKARARKGYYDCDRTLCYSVISNRLCIAFHFSRPIASFIFCS